MKPNTKALLLLSFSTLSLAACNIPNRLENAQYWQRSNATSALYLRGPKAQQTLHSDMVTCMNTINELENMDVLHNAIPPNTRKGMVPDPSTPKGKMAKVDSPDRDGYLYAEQFPYQDFETCMISKGWDRVETLPYEQAKVAREEYLANVYGYKAQTKNQDLNNKESPANAYESSSPGMSVNN